MPPVPFRLPHLSLLFVVAALASAALTQALPPLARTVGTGARPLAVVITAAGALALGAGILAAARTRRRGGARRPTAWSVRADVPGPGHDRPSFPLQPASGDAPPAPPEHPRSDDHDPGDHDSGDHDPGDDGGDDAGDDAGDDWSGQHGQPEAGDDWALAPAPSPSVPPAPASSASASPASPASSASASSPSVPPAPASSASASPASSPPGRVPPSPDERRGAVFNEAPGDPTVKKPWWNEDPNDFRAELLADAGRSVERTSATAPPSDRSEER